MKSIAIAGNERLEVGKTMSKVIRAEDGIPCVLYSSEGTVHFSVKPLDVRDLVYTAEFKLADINVNGDVHRCILKSVQFHPVTDRIMHIDFLKLIPGEKVKVEIPLRFSGVAPGVKAGGKLIQLVRKIKIKTTPERMVDQLLVDISGLELGQSVRVKDVQFEDGIEVLNSPSIPVASIEIPRALRSAAAAADKGKK